MLSDVFACAGDDQWVAVELEDAADAEAAAKLVGAADPWDLVALHGALARWASGQTAVQARRRLQEQGLAAGEVRDTADEFADAQLWGRQGMIRIQHPLLGSTVYLAPFQRFSKTPACIRRHSAQLGEHNEEVRRDWLGEAATIPTES